MEGVRSWYPTLDKPPWTPPNAAFGPIWSFLYTAMAVGAWDAARAQPHRARTVYGLFAVQLLLNAAWSPLFFAWHLTGTALLVMSALWFVLLTCVEVFRHRSRLAAALYLPYVAWITLAWSLNAWVWVANG